MGMPAKTTSLLIPIINKNVLIEMNVSSLLKKPLLYPIILNVTGLGAFGTISDLKFYSVTLFQGFEPFSLNGGVVDKYILSTFNFDKPKPFLSLNHFTVPVSFCIFQLSPVCA
jgi:hypothetical protein